MVFITDLTDAILVKDEADVALVEAALAKEGLTLEGMDKRWRDNHIKRSVLEGTKTQAAVLAVLKKYEDKVCPITGKAVATEAVWQVYNNQSVADIELGGKLYNTWDLAAGEACWPLGYALGEPYFQKHNSALAPCMFGGAASLSKQCMLSVHKVYMKPLQGLAAVLCALADALPIEEIYVQREGKAGVDKLGLKVYYRQRGTSYGESTHGRHNKPWTAGTYGPEYAQVNTTSRWHHKPPARTLLVLLSLVVMAGRG